ncbi:MAG TPA: hypothetical protein VKU44_03245 [Terriglobia bacterium]|nr:hypothetical protein [Terriglobia bacterium]
MDPQHIIEVCQANFAANKSACNEFVRAVAQALGVTLFTPNDLADAMVDKLRSAPDWSKPADGAAAKAQADAGWLVIGGLKGADETPPAQHGHVVVVVTGLLDPGHNKYPTAYWGKLNGTGAEDTTVNWAWNAADRDRVEYFGKSLDPPALTSTTPEAGG